VHMHLLEYRGANTERPAFELAAGIPDHVDALSPATSVSRAYHMVLMLI
jgi:hypothetical protein